jgi:hypothetical protein
MQTLAATVNTPVSLGATGDIVAAVTGQRVYVFSGEITAAAPVTVDLQNGSTSLTGVQSLIAGVSMPFPPTSDGQPIFVTALGAAFHAVLGGSVQVSGYFRTFQG